MRQCHSIQYFSVLMKQKVMVCGLLLFIIKQEKYQRGHDTIELWFATQDPPLLEVSVYLIGGTEVQVAPLTCIKMNQTNGAAAPRSLESNHVQLKKTVPALMVGNVHHF